MRKTRTGKQPGRRLPRARCSATLMRTGPLPASAPCPHVQLRASPGISPGPRRVSARSLRRRDSWLQRRCERIWTASNLRVTGSAIPDGGAREGCRGRAHLVPPTYGGCEAAVADDARHRDWPEAATRAQRSIVVLAVAPGRAQQRPSCAALRVSAVRESRGQLLAWGAGAGGVVASPQAA
jgi:hypothetical protein